MDSIYPLVVTEAAAAWRGTDSGWAGGILLRLGEIGKVCNFLVRHQPSLIKGSNIAGLPSCWSQAVVCVSFPGTSDC